MDDFVGVVGVVVGNEEGFAQNGLARAVRNSGQQVGFVIMRQVNEALAVGVDVVQRGLPLLHVGGGVPGGPVPATPATHALRQVKNPKMFHCAMWRCSTNYQMV